MDCKPDLVYFNLFGCLAEEAYATVQEVLPSRLADFHSAGSFSQSFAASNTADLYLTYCLVEPLASLDLLESLKTNLLMRANSLALG